MRLASLLIPLLSLAACGEVVHTDDIDAPSADVDAPPGGCGANGNLALNAKGVSAGRVIPAGRLAVLFFQLNDDLMPRPSLFLGADLPFAALSPGMERCTEIDLRRVQVPTSDDLLVCARTCTDLNNSACDCPAAQAKASLAFVVVVPDGNGNGMLDPAEYSDPDVYGFGYLALASAPQAYPLPNPLGTVFTEGLDAGLHPYRVIDGDPIDTLGKGQPNTVYPLDLCDPTDTGCQPRVPNIQ